MNKFYCAINLDDVQWILNDADENSSRYSFKILTDIKCDFVGMEFFIYDKDFHRMIDRADCFINLPHEISFPFEFDGYIVKTSMKNKTRCAYSSVHDLLNKIMYLLMHR